jgi:hypothetical protein
VVLVPQLHPRIAHRLTRGEAMMSIRNGLFARLSSALPARRGNDMRTVHRALQVCEQRNDGDRIVGRRAQVNHHVRKHARLAARLHVLRLLRRLRRGRCREARMSNRGGDSHRVQKQRACRCIQRLRTFTKRIVRHTLAPQEAGRRYYYRHE